MTDYTKDDFDQLYQDHLCLIKDFEIYKQQRDKEVRFLFDENNKLLFMSFWERLKYAFTGKI